MPDNITKLRHAYQRWSETLGASVSDWMALMADDVSLRTAGDGAAGLEFTKGRSGKAEIESYFEGLATDWEMVHFTPKEFIESGDRIVVLSNVAFRSKKTGKVAESPKADVYRFRDGQIVEVAEYFDTYKAVLAATPG